jgi:hypothetical protein
MTYPFTGFRLIGVFVLLAFAAGCANTPQTENMLSAAGFTTKPATTAQQQQHLKTLVPNKVTLVQRKGKTYYVYADPAHNQIYVGNQAQYQRYQQLRQANNLAQENLEAAELNQQTAMGWGVWEPWGF